MGEIRKHLCESCGGVLTVDVVKQIYTCQFCGLTYDYAYFKEDDVLEKARRYEEHGEYTAALEAYNFYLTKNPNSEEIIEKVILLTYGISSVEELSKDEVADNFSKGPKEAEILLEKAGPAATERTKDIVELIRLACNCYESNLKINDVDEKLEAAKNRDNGLTLEILNYYYTVSSGNNDNITSEYNPKDYFNQYLKIASSIYGGLMILVVFAMLFNFTAGLIYAIICTVFYGILTLSFFISMQSRIAKIEACESKRTEVKAKIDEAEKQKRELVKENNGYKIQIKRILLKMKESITN